MKILMNNKTLIVAIVVLGTIGGVLLLIGQFGGKKAPTQSSNIPSAQNEQGGRPAVVTSAPGEIAKETVENVKVTASGFVPQTLTVNAGSRVVWFNETDEDATVHSDDHPTHRLYPELNAGQFSKGTSVQTVLTKPGTYTYHNHLNPSQKGTIIVK